MGVHRVEPFPIRCGPRLKIGDRVRVQPPVVLPGHNVGARMIVGHFGPTSLCKHTGNARRRLGEQRLTGLGVIPAAGTIGHDGHHVGHAGR